MMSKANAHIHLCLLFYALVLTESRTDKDKRLLLDNPEAISSQLQALRAEVQSLRSQVVDQATEIRSLKQAGQGGGNLCCNSYQYMYFIYDQ